MDESILIGITGASGSIYGLRLLETLAGAPFNLPVGLVISSAGRLVMSHELGIKAAADEDLLATRFEASVQPRITIYRPEDMAAACASGSNRFKALVVAPCSMNTVAAIAAGITLNLIHRLADVALKEKRPLILMPRETPMSATHLENMLNLANKGVTILPAAPGFYHQPATVGDMVNFMVGKVLDQLGMDHELYGRWEGKQA